MKAKLIVFSLAAATGVFIFWANAPAAKNSATKNLVLMQMINSSLDQGHYQPVKMDNKFSESVFTLYIEHSDPLKKFFLQSDIKEMEKYKTKIDEQVNDGNFEFFDKSYEIINQRVLDCEKIYKNILANPFEFEKEENFETDPDKSTFPTDAKDQKEQWRKYLKYQILIRVSDMMDDQEKAKEKNDSTFKQKTFAQMEEDARKKVVKSNDDLFKRLKKLDYNDRLSVYINTVTNMYDPHTEFFPVKEKKNFDEQMSGQFEGIGAKLQEKDGYVKVSEIIPGSASWRQGQLKAGDLIIKVAQGDGEPMDVVGMPVDDVIPFIRGKKGTEVRLTVKKQDGTQVVIPIVRDVVLIEETFAQSLLLDTKKKIGYIKLPVFYSDFGKNGARTCADDIRKELEKLKKENIEGLIFDLRDNGGGSLQDVVKMVGLFINKGPVVQVKQKNMPASLLSDRDPAVVYDGPLVVMVNEGSASASEIFAAAIQDYGRGIIVGSNTTFGKGTVQQFYNLDDYLLPQFDTLKPLGSIKLTTQKFYRINGGTTQLKGVTPDIIFPDLLKYAKYGEKELENPLQWDQVPAADYTKYAVSYNADKIKTNSYARVQSNNVFKLVDDEAKFLKQEQDNSIESLNLNKFRDARKKFKTKMKQYDEVTAEIKDWQIKPLKADMEELKKDTVLVSKNNDWIKRLKKDIYLNECTKIIDDMR
jgi:carboxyl-terminal processing protease